MALNLFKDKARKNREIKSTTCHLPPATSEGVALEKITYCIYGKKKTIQAKILKHPLEKAIGLMFKKNSPPLLFVCKKFQWLPITSYFCKPFRAIWLDKNMSATKVIDVKKWNFNISGHGKYLLEIPLS